MSRSARGVLGGGLLVALGAVAFSWSAPTPVGGEDLVPATVASRRAVLVVDVERREPGAGDWQTARSVTAVADSGLPAWPEPALRRGERLGGHTAQYTVTYRRESGITSAVLVDSATWDSVAAGDHAALRLAADGTPAAVLPADSLAECRRWHRDPGNHPVPDSVAALGCSP